MGVRRVLGSGRLGSGNAGFHESAVDPTSVATGERRRTGTRLALPATAVRVTFDFDTFLGWAGAGFPLTWMLLLAAVFKGRDTDFRDTVLPLRPLFGTRTVAPSPVEEEDFRFARVGEAVLLLDLTVREVRFEIVFPPVLFFTGGFPNIQAPPAIAKSLLHKGMRTRQSSEYRGRGTGCQPSEAGAGRRNSTSIVVRSRITPGS